MTSQNYSSALHIPRQPLRAVRVTLPVPDHLQPRICRALAERTSSTSVKYEDLTVAEDPRGRLVPERLQYWERDDDARKHIKRSHGWTWTCRDPHQLRSSAQKLVFHSATFSCFLSFFPFSLALGYSLQSLS